MENAVSGVLIVDIKLSICIPTYNFGKFIGETLDSIIRQANSSIEIVIGDGASTDNTEEVVKGYLSGFPNLVYEKFEKKGGIDTDLEKTIGLAKGKYCWLLSSDDVLKPGAIKRILDEIELGYSIYLCNRTQCDKNLNEINSGHWLRENIHDSVFDFSKKNELLYYLNVSESLGALFSYISSIVVRRSDWLNIKSGVDAVGTNYAHVHKLFSIALRGGKVSYISDPLVSTRLFNDSFMVNGIARRYLIDFNGYQLISEILFDDSVVLDQFRNVMRREHKWYFLPSLAAKVKDKKEWSELVRMLRIYGYSSFILHLSRVLGKSMAVIVSAIKLKKISIGRNNDE
jgi:abequosyltransferase